MPSRKRPRNSVAGRMVGGMAAGALPPLCLAVGVHNVPESHLAVVSGVDRKFASISYGANRVHFPTAVQRNRGNASDLDAQLASGGQSSGSPHRLRT